MAKTTDVSKKTVMVLAFLVIVISIFSTWALLSATTPQIVRNSGEAKGMVMLQILGDTPQSGPTQVTGNVGLTILPSQ
ncbi:MAG: hypothetical protein AABY01_00050 [Nanoarchaeota archaeon]